MEFFKRYLKLYAECPGPDSNSCPVSHSFDAADLFFIACKTCSFSPMRLKDKKDLKKFDPFFYVTVEACLKLTRSLQISKRVKNSRCLWYSFFCFNKWEFHHSLRLWCAPSAAKLSSNSQETMSTSCEIGLCNAMESNIYRK